MERVDYLKKRIEDVFKIINGFTIYGKDVRIDFKDKEVQELEDILNKLHNLWTLDLHEQYDIDNYTMVKRIAAGWFYYHWNNELDCFDAPVFAPFYSRDDFRKDKKII